MIGATTWTVSGGRVLGPAPFLLAGVVNATPDSFFDGGRYADPEAALARCARLAADGADMLDIGGESTRPGAPEVPADEELRRVLPVLRGLAELQRSQPDAPRPVLSVDTWKAAVAAEALNAGAAVVNDVSACRFDPALMDVLAQHKRRLEDEWRAYSDKTVAIASLRWTRIVSDIGSPGAAFRDGFSDRNTRPAPSR